MFYKVIKVIGTIFVTMVQKIRLVGKENIPKEGGYILACSHRSNFDPITMGVIFPQQIFFMAKAELFRGKFANWFIRKMGAFPVERGKGDTGAIDHAVEIVAEKKVLGIFPEGTRTKKPQLLPVKSGVAVIAARTGAPVLPCSICYGKWRGRKRVCFSVGKMIPPEQLSIGSASPSEIKQSAKLIMSKITELFEEQQDYLRKHG